MTDKPMLFAAPMVRAILREIREPGTGKTQTRRIYKSIPASEPQQYNVGDRIWVRETHALTNKHAYRLSVGVDQRVNPANDYDASVYRACFDRSTSGLRWRPSIHMPRWASRITLEVTDLRYQRLQDITGVDALAEGCKGFVSHDGEDGLSPREEFRDLWDSLNGTPRKPGGQDISWQANPWVMAVTFRPHLCNIDEMEKAA